MFLRAIICSTLIFLCFIIPSAFSAEGFEYILDANTLALWHMNDENDEKVIDESANHYEGKIEGKAGWGEEGWKKEGKPGKSFIFDGATVINVGDVKSLKNPDSITIEAWVYPKNLSGWKLICANWSGPPGAYHLACDNSVPKLHITTDKGSANADSPKPLQVEKWYHIAGSYDSQSGDINLYIDGAKVATKNLGGKLIDNVYDVIIGSKHEKIYQWNGMMDEVRISKSARDPKELSPNLSGPQAINPSGSLATTWGKAKVD